MIHIALAESTPVFRDEPRMTGNQCKLPGMLGRASCGSREADTIARAVGRLARILTATTVPCLMGVPPPSTKRSRVRRSGNLYRYSGSSGLARNIANRKHVNKNCPEGIVRVVMAHVIMLCLIDCRSATSYPAAEASKLIHYVAEVLQYVQIPLPKSGMCKRR